MPCLRVYDDGVTPAFGTIFAVFPSVIPQRSWTQFDVMWPRHILSPPDSARPKFAQSAPFKAWQLLVTLVSPFQVTHVHSSWHCSCWAGAIEGIAISPTTSTTFFSIVAPLIVKTRH